MQKFILRKQVREKYGVLAEIYCDIELMESDQKEFIIDYRADARWALPCRMGIE